jgi:hypothetical protein
MSSSKKLTCKGTFFYQVLSVWGPESHTPPPLTHCIRVYSILIHTGKGGEGQCRRVLYIPSLGWKNTNMTECTRDIGYLQYINSSKHLPQSPFTGQFFRRRHFACHSMSLILYDSSISLFFLSDSAIRIDRFIIRFHAGVVLDKHLMGTLQNKNFHRVIYFFIFSLPRLTLLPMPPPEIPLCRRMLGSNPGQLRTCDVGIGCQTF